MLMKDNNFHKNPERYIKPLIEEAVYTFFIKNEEEFRGEKLIDIGCGDQPFRKFIKKQGIQYKSLDIKQNMGGSIDYIAQIDKPLGREVLKEEYSIILCTEVLEHVADWETTFENFFKVLRPGGVVIITAPFFYFLHEEPYDFWRPTSHAFNYFAERFNFSVLINQQLGDGWDVLGSLLESSYLELKEKGLGIRETIKFKLFRMALTLIRKEVISGGIRKNSTLSSPFFHSNFVVLRK